MKACAAWTGEEVDFDKHFDDWGYRHYMQPWTAVDGESNHAATDAKGHYRQQQDKSLESVCGVTPPLRPPPLSPCRVPTPPFIVLLFYTVLLADTQV